MSKGIFDTRFTICDLRGVNRVAILLRTLAPALGRTDTWLAVFHRRMKTRMGPAAANTAAARKLATH